MVDNALTQAIKLTDTETQLFDTLMAVVKHNSLQTTVRVNGGWVRDKMLGLESDDIDLSLDDMYGEDFAKIVTEYLKT